MNLNNRIVNKVSLQNILAWQNLEEAWRQVEANKSAPGVDEVTVKRWARNWETNLHRLMTQVRTNTYHPNRPRRYKVAKKDGTYRELSILTVTDRVMQRAVLNVLEEVFEKEFLNCSFGYRPRRSVANAVTAVVRNRERGLRCVFDADIEQCFESLDHEIVMECLRRVVNDAALLRLIELWLKVGANQKSIGVPLGAVISPLLCNVVLHELDAALTRAGWTMARYADDFIVMTRHEGEAQQVWGETERALDGLKLRLNPDKTRVATFDEGFTFLGVEFKGDTYSYIHQQKKIKVKGPTVKILHTYQPEFY